MVPQTFTLPEGMTAFTPGPTLPALNALKTKQLYHCRLPDGALATVQVDESNTWRWRRMREHPTAVGYGEGSRVQVEAFMQGAGTN